VAEGSSEAIRIGPVCRASETTATAVTIAAVPAGQLADRPLTEPHRDRLALDHPRRTLVLALHAAALEAGDVGYTDPDSGLFVLTAGYLRDRRYCCERGCRHCPYYE
jgi:hypothetical protein